MEAKELAALSGCPIRLFFLDGLEGKPKWVDLKVVEQVDTATRDTCGGMFCDEPGLGKTITMLALILRTKGQSMHTKCTHQSSFGELAGSFRTAENLVSSGASLIVVPDPLLAAYDVVVTSFSRLVKEWKLHRPASELEKRMPERYGFEDAQRYTDGTIRGECLLF
ncbi:P-loop containing nucleoside triphosphate hydrolase [Phytophthora cactorum]|nr:P-loop containing nucleoside triphosphate hydrolase [Phytophthora cactorum]